MRVSLPLILMRCILANISLKTKSKYLKNLYTVKPNMENIEKSTTFSIRYFTILVHPIVC